MDYTVSISKPYLTLIIIMIADPHLGVVLIMVGQSRGPGGGGPGGGGSLGITLILRYLGYTHECIIKINVHT